MEWHDRPDEESSPFTFTFQEPEKPDKRLADPITTPRKGPLVLSKQAINNMHSTTRRSKTLHQSSHRERERYLNRFPVPNIQRPIDIIEYNLGRLSLAELKEQAFSEWSGERHGPILPTLNPLMKYTPIGHHGNSVVESHTHKTSGSMNILITYSRHQTPGNLLTQEWTLPYQTERPRYMSMGHSAQIRNQINPLSTLGRTTLLTRTNTTQPKHDDRDSETTQPPLPSPRQQPGPLLTRFVRPTLAPHSIQAVAVHKFKPVTAQTIIKGQRLFPHTLESKRFS